MVEEILRARAHADAALAAARLPAIGIYGGALQIAAMGNRDGDVFHRDQVFQADFADVLDDLGAAFVAEFFLHLAQFFDDQTAQNFLSEPEFPDIR